MTGKVEFVVGVVGQGANGTAAINTIVQSNGDGVSNFNLVNNIGQIVVSVTGIFPVLAPIGFQTNTVAGTMTFLKIVGDLKEGKSLDVGDVLTLTGNIVGIAATVAIITGAAPAAITLGAVGILINVVGIGLASDGLKDYAAEQISKYWPPDQPAINLNDKWIDTEGRARRYIDIVSDPNSGFLNTVWDGKTVRKEKANPPPKARADEPMDVDGDGLDQQ
jgi:aconitase B